MRKLFWLCLTFALLLAALILAPLSGAKKIGQSKSADQNEKTAAQQKQSGSRSFKAVGFAESIPVRDFPAVEAKKFSGKVRELEHFEKEESAENKYGVEEKNEKNREIIRHTDPNAPRTPDQALSTKRSRGNAPTPHPPNPPTVNFEGQSIADTIAVGQGFLPPDTNGDVGPNNYVQTVNVTFRVWDKAGNPLTPVASLNTLFGPLGGSCGGSEDGDPIVMYDQLADRWMISQFCTVADPNNHQLIAISKTGDPTGSYYLYNFMMPNNKFNDYPHFGVWPDAYYMTDNQFNQAGTAFLQDGVFAFDRTKMLVGDPAASFIYFDTAVLFPPGTGINGTDGIGGMLAADLDGYIPPPAGAPCPFVYFQAGENAGEPGDQLRIFDFHADFGIPANSTFIERTGSPLVVAAFDPIPVPNSRNVVPQPPPATAGSFLDAISDRLMFRMSYRNLGTSEKLVLNHTVNAATNPVFRAGVRWYELTRNAPAAAWGIAEQETWAPAGTEHRWMGSAAVNFQNDVAVGYSVSSATVFPSVRYAARRGTDTPGTGLIQGEQTIVAGGGSQTSTSGRWGDYSDITVDPSDDCTFWYTQEYYSVSTEPGNTTAPWHTRIAKFAPGPCSTSPRGTISGTITNCATGLPIQNAFVTITGGTSRATGAAGTYSAIVTPGTYNASVTGTGYDTASATGLVVANGGNATFSACLVGNLKQPVADTASITADSCNSNGVIDPNETVTVSLGVKNTGTLNTVNLVGTLQATGGVTSPSGPQNYGVVVAGGSTVFRSFTFTAGNVACGAPIVLSLQLQDGATNLGTVTYNFTTGTIASNNYSTGDISVAIPDSPAPAINIPLTVADVMTLTDVNVSFRINHTFDGDLTIAIVHPDGTVIPLVTNRGSSGANFGTGPLSCAGVPTVIDDQAATAISAGAAPFAASFRPESPLSALNGKPSNGTWNLRVQDTASVDTGTVGCFKLELNKRNVCCGALINAAPPPVITAESVSPANNAPDPGETVTVNLSLLNVGGNNTGNLVATLQNSGGVTPVTTSANYGVVVASGPAVTRPFTFVASGACGSNITLTLALQDGATNLGTVTYTMTLGTPSVATIFSQNFDGVTPPALPAGWTTAATGVEVNWVTSATNPSSAPNDAFAPDVNNIGNTTLDTPTINVPAGGGQLTFKNLYNMEASASATGAGFDGMVLEISINGGAFNDITTGGNAFIAGGYNRTISPSFSSPIAGRTAWSALSGGTTAAPTYITSTINLPAAAAGQPIKLRWRAATDDSATAAGASGVRIDTIAITSSSFVCNTQTCSVTCPGNITVPADGGGTSAVVNYPPATPTGACGALGYDVPSGSTFPVGTTTVHVTGANAAACSFTVTVTAPAGGPPPANDNCANAIAVTPANCGFTDTQDTTGATDEVGEPQSTCTLQANSVWYSYTNNTVNEVLVTVQTCTSDFDTAIQVWEVTGAACDFNTFVAVACNDDACGDGFQSSLSFTAAPGKTYKIQSGGFDGETGNLTTTINCQVFTCPTSTIHGTLGSGSPDHTFTTGNQTGRLNRNGVSSTCSTPKTCQIFDNAGARQYDAYTFPNSSGADACTLVDLAVTTPSGVNLQVNAYLDSYDPANICSGYLADPGLSSGDPPSPTNMSFTVPAGHSVVLVVHTVNPGNTGGNYTLTVRGNLCASCSITCPTNISREADSGQNGAVVNYPAPTTTGSCGTINCSPASGSFFPVGTTTVTCTSTVGPSCNFTVTVRPPRYWSSIGAAATTDEDSTAIVSFDDFSAQLKDGVTGTATVRYNITAVRGISAFCPATQSVVNVRFRNSDNTGAHAQVKFEIHRTHILNGGNDIIYAFNSNGLGAGSAFTSVSAAPSIDFDFSNYIYWIEGTVFRDQAGQFADLGDIQIHESAGTPCP